jgi:glycosyltransferase involved in cell wall biosynthesis
MGFILLYTRFFEFTVSRVIDVFQLVREHLPQARLLVVGAGLFGEEEELFRLAAAAGLKVARPSSSLREAKAAQVYLEDISEDPPDVTYAGWVPLEALPSYFAQASVAIYPYDDTLVNRAKCAVKLTDLLAAGVPVVAEAVGQNREYIQDGETGLLVEPGDVHAFARSVVQLLEHPSLRRRLSQAAARDVRERFSWQTLVDAVEHAYGVGV